MAVIRHLLPALPALNGARSDAEHPCESFVGQPLTMATAPILPKRSKPFSEGAQVEGGRWGHVMNSLDLDGFNEIGAGVPSSETLAHTPGETPCRKRCQTSRSNDVITHRELQPPPLVTSVPVCGCDPQAPPVPLVGGGQASPWCRRARAVVDARTVAAIDRCLCTWLRLTREVQSCA